jgi:hypothetical protein
MTDHAEEQEMESEAMAAIFDTHFEILGPSQWGVIIYPESGDPSELDALNHVGCKLLITLPATYPEDLPDLDIEIVKGLAEEQRQELKTLADEEALANQGVPSMFAVTERLREWLLENNVKGLDDVSMHAQMMRKEQQQERAQVRWSISQSGHPVCARLAASFVCFLFVMLGCVFALKHCRDGLACRFSPKNCTLLDGTHSKGARGFVSGVLCSRVSSSRARV